MFTPDELSAYATCIAAVAALLSAVAAFKANSTAKSAIKLQQQLENSKLSFIKHQESLKLLQSIISSFAEIEALAKSDRCDENTQKIDEVISRFQGDIEILKAINSEIGALIYSWEIEREVESDSIPRVVYYIIGNLHAIIGDKYDEFFKAKKLELSNIQEQLFKSIAKFD
ncbi:hypothetical protein ACUSRQ_005086 [Vibrio harveyi]|uniref:DUF4760 domain-containing protein n=2 Tax=Vibrio harveyi TaxID=669 RepID=A0ABN4KUE6_VIBHA|nr:MULTISPECIES: hypothetical protein [Vibrio]AMF96704.1 hypothetical protein AL538_02625 [Vibrio harveyi]ARR44167.1 hypothetical protein CAY59_07270 [Vibrio campbellii]EKO3846474.1 hypothetical protein [Vibrio harveyi]MDS1873276.1 hypothetical protein [Vibrio vulnificus]OQU31461.1 hypothetical protein EN05_009685 [Vibrio parahaemolyticus]